MYIVLPEYLISALEIHYKKFSKGTPITLLIFKKLTSIYLSFKAYLYANGT